MGYQVYFKDDSGIIVGLHQADPNARPMGMIPSTTALPYCQAIYGMVAELAMTLGLAAILRNPKKITLLFPPL